MYFKGIVTRVEYFLKVLKPETVLFEWALVVFKILMCLFLKEIQIKVSACFYDHLRIVKFFPVTRFIQLVPAF